eukprot:gene23313-27734_t
MERNQRASPANRGTNAACMSPEFYATWDGNHDDPRFSRKYQYADGTWFMNNATGSVPASDILTQGGGFEMTTDGRIKVSELYMEKSTNTRMDFTPELNFDNPSQAVFAQDQINRGVRVFKYEFDPEEGNGSSNVDIPLVRLGAIYTMRAEAYFRKGQTSLALDDINRLRTSRTRESLYSNAAGVAISALDEASLYREIAFETYWELYRRPQMIRFGKYEKAFSAKPVSQPFRRVFPIPQTTLD